VSDTPRTDREEYKTGPADVGFPVVNPSLCRILERESAERLALLVRANDALNGMIGLVQLVSGNRYPDFPVDNHRVIEAQSCANALSSVLCGRTAHD
jgi:hypothetical protein